MEKIEQLKNDRLLNKLEYDKVRAMLVSQCTSESGKRIAEQLKPTANRNDVIRYQKETTEALHVRHSVFDIPLGGVVDIEEPLKKISVGSALSGEEFLKIGSILFASHQMKMFFENSQQKFRAELLEEYSDKIALLQSLEQKIRRTFDEHGEVLNSASDKLSAIRGKITILRQRIRGRMEELLRQLTSQDYLQDSIIAMRGDHFVLPVKAEHKQHVKGIVHDQSASGATLYIEPLDVVERSNEVQQLLLDEHQEIQRILFELTQELIPYEEVIRKNWETLAYYDFIFAKAKLSDLMEANEPEFVEGAVFNFYRAKHPLLNTDKAIPIDINLGYDADCLVITGPNTGGKTVTLKTVGLLILMYQSGLHIPVAIGSEIGLFEAVFADIGDEQSIEQSLSTFSSHFRNIAGILEQANKDSLILYDELGAGTDPDEGSALAISVLEHSMKLGSKIVATTHYGELKSFAFQTERVQNASVEFDVKSLKPTYRLLMGVSGNSNAFDISERIGLPLPIIDRARNYLEESRSESERLIKDLEEAQYAIHQREERVARHLRDLKEREDSIKKSEKDLELKREQVLQKAREQAAEILLDAKRSAEQVTKELKTLHKDANLEASQRANKISRNLSDSAYSLREKNKKKTTVSKSIKNVSIGDRVHINHFSQDAIVLTESDKEGNFQVQVGVMKMEVNLKDITSPERKKVKDRKQFHQKSQGKLPKTASLELDLRGMTTEEVMPILDKYLDDAYLSNVPQVQIIHGKGTGVLRKYVHEKLRNTSFIASYRLGDFNEGGDGVTIAEIK